MRLEEEMFEIIEDWKKSNKRKSDFLKDKGISIDKFGYWLSKYNKKYKLDSSSPNSLNSSSNFKEITLPVSKDELRVKKLLELRTSKGIEITIFG